MDSKLHTAKTIFITGTDTGAGKTLLTALLLQHALDRGLSARAVKPFSTGKRNDAKVLKLLMGNVMQLDEINPFHFKRPGAPYISARYEKGQVELSKVVSWLQQQRRKSDFLLVEGIGGVMVPLGEGYTVLDLLQQVRMRVMVAAVNRLGVINHVLLTVKALQAAGVEEVGCVMMEVGEKGFAVGTNVEVVREIISPVPVYWVPYMGCKALGESEIKKSVKKVQKTLEEILGTGRLVSA
jgi:dethiobiotin synthase